MKCVSKREREEGEGERGIESRSTSSEFVFSLMFLLLLVESECPIVTFDVVLKRSFGPKSKQKKVKSGKKCSMNRNKVFGN